MAWNRVERSSYVPLTRTESTSGVARLLIRVNVPDDIVGQSEHAVARALRHLGEAFCLGLVLECVGGEVDA